MPQTKEYAKLGRTTYVAVLYGNNGDHPYGGELRRREFVSKAAVERWIMKTLPCEQKVCPLTVHGEIRQGVYKDCSFDVRGGRIYDAVWEPTEVRAYCQLVDGLPDVEWEE